MLRPLWLLQTACDPSTPIARPTYITEIGLNMVQRSLRRKYFSVTPAEGQPRAGPLQCWQGALGFTQDVCVSTCWCFWGRLTVGHQNCFFEKTFENVKEKKD